MNYLKEDEENIIIIKNTLQTSFNYKTCVQIIYCNLYCIIYLNSGID